MAKKARNELAAGGFVIAGVLTLLGVVLWLGSSHIFEQPQGTIYFTRSHADGPAGLRNGTEVRLGDLKVGQVRYLADQTDRRRILYVVDLTRGDIKFYANGVAEVQSALVGDSYLAIKSAGTPDAGPTTEANAIPILGGMGEMMDKANKAIRQLSEQLDPNHPGSLVEQVSAILGDVKGITVSLRFAVDPNKDNSFLSRAMAAMLNVVNITADVRLATDPNRRESILATLGRVMTDAEPKVAVTLTDLSATAGKIREYTEKDVGLLLTKLHDISGEVLKGAQNLDEITVKAKNLVDRNSPSLDEMVQNFVLVSANLNATATEVRRAPWRLLYQPPEKELNSQNILDAARAFSAGATQLDQAVTRMNAIDPKTVSPEDLKQVRDRLKEVFEKFSKAEQSLFKELGKADK